MADLLVLPRPAKSLQNGAGFSGNTSAYWACCKEKGGLSATDRAVGKYARAIFAKRERNRAVSPEHQIVRRAFSVREVKRTTARKNNEMSIPLQKDSESQSK